MKKKKPNIYAKSRSISHTLSLAGASFFHFSMATYFLRYTHRANGDGLSAYCNPEASNMCNSTFCVSSNIYVLDHTAPMQTSTTTIAAHARTQMYKSTTFG